MGFRSTITTEDLRGVVLPKWFIKKWKEQFYIGKNRDKKSSLYLASKFETKFYNGKDEEIFIDLQKICIENDIKTFIVVILHECGGITRVQIEKDNIRLSEPSDWEEVEEITHNYCYGCSDLTLGEKK